ncbi:MAG: DUF1343 domain-containing protein [Thermodesulfovibrionales bacterium]|nr:DUF1343 domain-containing protein [Thermodesulfovibrionales bacterium]
MTPAKVQSGLDLLERKWPRSLKDARIGLLVHPASVNKNFEHAVSVFLKSRHVRLSALFGPQHGIFGQTQDNMIEWEGFRDTITRLPVYSLYGRTRKPVPRMLKDIDVLVIDLQDIGSRYYTFIWTMELCMKACASAGKAVLVLDRPNPIGGRTVEGPVLDEAFASFVGGRPLPVRHGMTIGEIGYYLKAEFYPSLDFHVIPMKGWRRMWFDETGLPWVMPSPNMPTPNTALVYPGMCLLEGTNLSEGRGTTRPFEIFGAPFIEPEALAWDLKEFRLPGVAMRPMHFEPAFQKHAGRLCGGCQIHVTDRDKFRPFKTAVAVIKSVRRLWPGHFAWKLPPYEYETEKMPVDILAGTDRLRLDIEKDKDIHRMEEGWKQECREFLKIRKRFLIYE